MESNDQDETEPPSELGIREGKVVQNDSVVRFDLVVFLLFFAQDAFRETLSGDKWLLVLLHNQIVLETLDVG